MNAALYTGLAAALLALLPLLFLDRMSGWSRLAEAYQAEGPFIGHIYKWNSARLNWISYNNCLDLGVSDEGFFMRVMVPFGFWSRPLLLPWSEISLSQQSGFFADVVTFEMRQVPNLKLRFLKKQILKIASQHPEAALFKDLKA